MTASTSESERHRIIDVVAQIELPRAYSKVDIRAHGRVPGSNGKIERWRRLLANEVGVYVGVGN